MCWPHHTVGVGGISESIVNMPCSDENDLSFTLEI